MLFSNAAHSKFTYEATLDAGCEIWKIPMRILIRLPVHVPFGKRKPDCHLRQSGFFVDGCDSYRDLNQSWK